MLRNIKRPLALLTMMVAMAAGASHAGAATAAPAVAKPPTVILETTFQPSGAGVQANLPPISCSITISLPTRVGMGGLGALVEVTGITTCTLPVNSIQSTTTLNYVVQGIPLTADRAPGFGNLSVTAVAATSCRNGTWEGLAEAFIVPPPDYYPRSGRLSKATPLTGITC